MKSKPRTKAEALLFTLKAWPIIAIATMGLCYLTELIAAGIGISLPEQANLDMVRQYLTRTFEDPRYLQGALILVAEVLIIMPVIEELIFRLAIFKGVGRMVKRLARASDDNREQSTAVDGYHRLLSAAIIASLLFSAAHYITQPWPDAAFLALFLFGMAQCWLYVRTGRLWCAMLNHTLFNLTNLVLLLVVPQ